MPLLAQGLDIDGYSKVVIPRSQGYWFNENAALREAVRDAGFEVHRSVDEIPREAWSTTLHMTAGLEADALTYYVVVFDVAAQTRIAYCTRNMTDVRPGHVPGRASGLDSLGKKAIIELVEGLGYQGFEQSAREANLRAFGLAATATQQSTPSEVPASSSRPRLSCGTAPPISASQDRRTRPARRRSDE